MRALTSDGKTLRLVRDHPEPAPTPGFALVRPVRALLTPGDYQVAHAVLDHAPRAFHGVLGHQFVGVVKSLSIPADAPSHLASRKSLLGARVVPASSIPCANCDLCRRALSAHCRHRRVPGMLEQDGGLAELVSLPITALHAVPDGVDTDAALLSPWLASAAHTANLLRSEEHTFITVLGESLLSLLTAYILSRKNASVRLLSARPEIAEICERWGVKQRTPEEPGRRQDQDVVVECAGSNASLALALQMVRPRGLIVLKNAGTMASSHHARLALNTAQPALDLTPAIINEVHIVGSREGPMPDALALLKVLSSELAALQPLIASRRVPLDQALPALQSGAHSTDNSPFAPCCVDLAA